MGLVERVRELCVKKDTTLVGLERDLKFGRGSIRKWNESSPSAEKLKKVADYFNVTTDYLLGIANQGDDKVQGLNRAYFRIAKDAQENGIDPEDLKYALDFLQRMKRKDSDN